MNEGSLGAPEIAFFTCLVFAAAAVFSYILRAVVLSRPCRAAWALLARRPLPQMQADRSAVDASLNARIGELRELVREADLRIAELRRLTMSPPGRAAMLEQGSLSSSEPKSLSASKWTRRPALQPLVVRIDDALADPEPALTVEVPVLGKSAGDEPDEDRHFSDRAAG